MNTATATLTQNQEAPEFVGIPRLVAFDLYRDIHKAIRCEMFAVTAAAGSLDPADLTGRREHAGRVHALVELLVHHAEHEDSNLDVVIARIDPAMAHEITAAHAELEARMECVTKLADEALMATDQRAGSHELYLELAAFTATYLQHQDFEERVVMRVLDQFLGLEQLLDLHGQILASVTPEVLARCIELMLPAVNIVDRTEMLAGMKATAPAEAFAGVWTLAGEVLSVREYVTTAARLGLPIDAMKVA